MEPKAWKEDVSLPILSLSHITHNQQAWLIRQSDSFFTFAPRQKVGKSLGKYDGSSVGKTFKKLDSDGYVEIPCSTSVFPGYLSWWGISCRELYETDPAGRKFREALDEIKYSNYYVYEADYLKSPPCSRYGNREFIFSLKDLMESYKQSRKDCKNKDVYLRKAGTLRYRCEVCYVVMVVMLKDLNDDPIQAMPSIFDEPRFEHNGCINPDGRLLNDRPPCFKMKHPFATFHNESHSWESLAFAFYFSKQDQQLQCSKKYGREEEVEHPQGICTSKQPQPQSFPGQYSPWLCPNL